MKKATKLFSLLFTIFFIANSSAFSQVTFNGNGNDGFGGVLGTGSFSVSDDGTTVTITFTKGSGDFNDALVIYIDSESGGITSTSNLTDTGDGLRQAISGFDGTNRSTITFPTGFQPDHVIAANVDDINFAGVWELVESGSHSFTASVDISSTDVNSASYSMTVDFSELGISDAPFTFVATYLNEGNAFRANEAIGRINTGSNPGQSAVTFNTYFTYDSGDENFSQSITGDAGWRLLSLPITGGTVADVSDDTPVQGITGGDNTGSDSNFKIYDDTGSFEDPTNTSTAWGDGYGFALYFFDNATAGSSELPVTLDAAGTEPSSDVTVNLNKSTTQGASSHYFTLVGNPFGDNFNLDSLSQNGDGLQDNVHFWDDGSSSYSSQDRTASGGYIISPWQGFWAEIANAGTSTTLTFPTDGKTSSDTTGTFFSKAVEEQRGDISFTLSSEDSYDEAIRMAFREYATEGFDRADASKLVPLIPTYATMAFKSETGLKSVESLPWNLTEEVTVELELQQVGVDGGFTFDWKGLETIPEEWDLTFHDYQEEINIDMREETEYVFNSEAPDAKVVNPLSILTGAVAQAQKSKSDEDGIRFAITITPNATSVNNETGDDPIAFELEQNYPNPFNPSTTINYTVASTGKVTLNVYNLMGQKVAELVNATKTAGSYNVSWDASGAASGMYIYRLEAGGQTLTRKMTLIK